MLSAVEVCEIAGVTIQTLHNWIRAGALHPVRKGSVGRNKGYRYSVAQCLAICELQSLETRSPSIEYTGHLLSQFESMSDQQLMKLVGEDMTEEEASEAVAQIERALRKSVTRRPRKPVPYDLSEGVGERMKKLIASEASQAS